MDLITELLKNIYLLRVEKIEEITKEIWQKYQSILNSASNIEELWEARVYLYVLGWFYPEKFGIESIKRRLKHLKNPISLMGFLDMIDKNKVNAEDREDLLFVIN